MAGKGGAGHALLDARDMMTTSEETETDGDGDGDWRSFLNLDDAADAEIDAEIERAVLAPVNDAAAGGAVVDAIDSGGAIDAIDSDGAGAPVDAIDSGGLPAFDSEAGAGLLAMPTDRARLQRRAEPLRPLEEVMDCPYRLEGTQHRCGCGKLARVCGVCNRELRLTNWGIFTGETERFLATRLEGLPAAELSVLLETHCKKRAVIRTHQDKWRRASGYRLAAGMDTLEGPPGSDDLLRRGNELALRIRLVLNSMHRAPSPEDGAAAKRPKHAPP